MWYIINPMEQYIVGFVLMTFGGIMAVRPDIMKK